MSRNHTTSVAIPRFRTVQDAALECFADLHPGREALKVQVLEENESVAVVGIRFQNPLSRPQIDFALIEVDVGRVIGRVCTDRRLLSRYAPLMRDSD